MSYNSYFFSHEKKVMIILVLLVMISLVSLVENTLRLVSFPDLNHSPLALVLGMRLSINILGVMVWGLTYCEAVYI